MEAIPEAGGQESRSPWSCWKPRPWRCWQGRQGLAAAGTGRAWAPAPPFLPNAPGHTAHLAVLWPPLSCDWLPLVPQPRQLLSTPRTLPGASKETHKHPGPLASVVPTQHRGGRELPQEAEGPPALGVTCVMGSPCTTPRASTPYGCHCHFSQPLSQHFLGAVQPPGVRIPTPHFPSQGHRAYPQASSRSHCLRCDMTQDPPCRLAIRPPELLTPTGPTCCFPKDKLPSGMISSAFIVRHGAPGHIAILRFVCLLESHSGKINRW